MRASARTASPAPDDLIVDDLLIEDLTPRMLTPERSTLCLCWYDADARTTI
jgi:hypothetical protein